MTATYPSTGKRGGTSKKLDVLYDGIKLKHFLSKLQGNVT